MQPLSPPRAAKAPASVWEEPSQVFSSLSLSAEQRPAQDRQLREPRLTPAAPPEPEDAAVPLGGQCLSLTWVGADLLSWGLKTLPWKTTRKAPAARSASNPPLGGRQSGVANPHPVCASALAQAGAGRVGLPWRVCCPALLDVAVLHVQQPLCTSCCPLGGIKDPPKPLQ